MRKLHNWTIRFGTGWGSIGWGSFVCQDCSAEIPLAVPLACCGRSGYLDHTRRGKCLYAPGVVDDGTQGVPECTAETTYVAAE